MRFLCLNGEEFCGNFEVVTEKKIGKWSDKLDFITPFLKTHRKYLWWRHCQL